MHRAAFTAFPLGLTDSDARFETGQIRKFLPGMADRAVLRRPVAKKGRRKPSNSGASRPTKGNRSEGTEMRWFSISGLRHVAWAAIASGSILTAFAAHGQILKASTPPEARLAAFAWRALATGFEVGEMPVLNAGREVDRILLARIDPARFRFILRHAPDGGRNLGEWMRMLGSVMVINGSFFAPGGEPDTPLLSNGIRSGPKDYHARHGAFVASDKFTGIRDLRKNNWRRQFRDAHDATVSYPLLLGADGRNTVQSSELRARRSFVGQDEAGRIVLGTTRAASFSLKGLADLQRASPLRLRLALNLDGGPYACQAIAYKGFVRNICGVAEEGGAPPRTAARGIRLPIVMAVLPRQ